MKETFNPSDEQYKKVEDLPKEERDKFADVLEEQGGGFVKKEAMETLDDSKTRADAIEERKAERGTWKRLLDTLLHESIKTTPLDVLHQDALGEDERREKEKPGREVSEKLKNGVALQELEQLDLIEEKIAYATHINSTFMDKIRHDIQMEIETDAREKLKEVGHEGLLFLGYCKETLDGCKHLTGKLDGKNIDVHSEVFGEIDGELARPEEGKKLIDAYLDIAISLFNTHPSHISGDYYESSDYGKFIDISAKNALQFGKMDADIIKNLRTLMEKRESLIQEQKKQKEENEKERVDKAEKDLLEEAENSVRDLLPKPKKDA